MIQNRPRLLYIFNLICFCRLVFGSYSRKADDLTPAKKYTEPKAEHNVALENNYSQCNQNIGYNSNYAKCKHRIYAAICAKCIYDEDAQKKHAVQITYEDDESTCEETYDEASNASSPTKEREFSLTEPKSELTITLEHNALECNQNIGNNSNSFLMKDLFFKGKKNAQDFLETEKGKWFSSTAKFSSFSLRQFKDDESQKDCFGKSIKNWKKQVEPYYGVMFRMDEDGREEIKKYVSFGYWRDMFSGWQTDKNEHVNVAYYLNWWLNEHKSFGKKWVKENHMIFNTDYEKKLRFLIENKFLEQALTEKQIKRMPFESMTTKILKDQNNRSGVKKDMMLGLYNHFNEFLLDLNKGYCSFPNLQIWYNSSRKNHEEMKKQAERLQKNLKTHCNRIFPIYAL